MNATKSDIINDIIIIKQDILELSDVIDKKCLEIYEFNQENTKKTHHYKLMMENLILEYHNVCKNLFK